jgi:tetratricopeptide (TPR) repeat protein
MNRMALVMAVGLVAGLGWAAADHGKSASSRPVELFEGLGPVHHPVSTQSPVAQDFFDQGLAFIYAFNHDEAVRSFRKAAEVDPKLAMAWWGVALALGPNYNLDAEPDVLKSAYEALQKAQELAKNAPAPEQAYIAALAKRYSSDPNPDKQKLAIAYKEAMGELHRRYPDDLDAATLYAESMMNLRPWELWSPDGKPAEGTEEIIAVLESVLRRNPDHPGANHYYIHAVEASPWPERALAAAERLNTLAPNAGHLVHMPSHIYIRVGDYGRAAKINEIAAEVDRRYIERSGVKGVYPLMYYSHNIHFISVAHALQGRCADAKKAGERLAAHVGPHVKDMPMLEGFMPIPTLILVRFNRWDELLAQPEPPEHMIITRAMWRFGRGVAFAAKGDLPAAHKERKAFAELVAKVPADAKYSDRNNARPVLGIAGQVFDARVALARKDYVTSIELLGKAAEGEDALKYMEPPDWILPCREALGAALVADGKLTEAEQVFRAELTRHRRNPRALFGLQEALRRQGKEHESRLIGLEFKSAWKNAEPKELRLEDL